ncbi:hypothetical protein M427DRAFT_33134 [Gonapodya prolifera JEL478]|uniref:Myb/SANT-like domain-containing protein n=1 Tax=Gonapodya prolifera (strain JEL478) TaxID=1344416 RepID=A0A139ACA6_GONPJ|nr:hypothetical protein M427DRAFT_33134 [Gonapodya prolifera JEL478]|eukprot:KXS14446.1 hypothetical protein M427DRAFT_33134 [Gonapodya prolifera JEL478]
MAKGKKEGGKRKRNNWTIDMSMHLYTLLEDEVKAGRSAQNGWKDVQWIAIAASISTKFNLNPPYQPQTVKQHEWNVKKEYAALDRLVRQGSGFGWDPIGKRVTALQGAWESFKDHDGKEYKKLQKFAKKPFPLWDKCKVVYEGQVATGEWAANPCMKRKLEQDSDTSSDEETDDSSSGSSDESGSEESEGDDMGLAQNRFKQWQVHGKQAPKSPEQEKEDRK